MPGFPCCCIDCPTDLYINGFARIIPVNTSSFDSGIRVALCLWNYSDAGNGEFDLELFGNVIAQRQYVDFDRIASTITVPIIEFNVGLFGVFAQCELSPDSHLVLEWFGTSGLGVPSWPANVESSGAPTTIAHGAVDQTEGSKGLSVFVRFVGDVLGASPADQPCSTPYCLASEIALNRLAQNPLRLLTNYSLVNSGGGVFGPPQNDTWRWEWWGPILEIDRPRSLSLSGEPPQMPDDIVPLYLKATVSGVKRGPAFSNLEDDEQDKVDELIGATQLPVILYRSHGVENPLGCYKDPWWGYAGGTMTGIGDGSDDDWEVLLGVQVVHNDGAEGIRAGLFSVTIENDVRAHLSLQTPFFVNQPFGSFRILEPSGFVICPSPVDAYNNNESASGGNVINWSDATISFESLVTPDI